MTNYWEKRQYSEQSSEPDDLAKRGLVLLLSEFWNMTASGTVSFAIITGVYDGQFAFYDSASSAAKVKGELIESPTSFAGTSSTMVPRNLNRNFPDTTTVTIQNASSVVGGTVIARELVGTGNKTGGTITSVKIHTLKANTTYIMQFVNQDNQTSVMHMNLAWTEHPITPPSLITAA